MTAILDHIVINVRFDMDRARGIFEDLGFTLTPRGHHTLGSINHLMMFGRDFLELIGIPEADAHKRKEISEAPFGLNGLVFKTGDVARAHARLDELGMAGDPPKSFSRPVALSDGSTRDASFRTVTARGDAFPAGRLYFCEHLTPELVWRPEWQTHANGATGFTELVIVTPGPEEEAARLASVLDARTGDAPDGGQAVILDGGFRLTLQTREDYDARFGPLARSGAGREAFFGAAGLRGASLDAINDRAGGIEGAAVSAHGGGLAVTVGAFDTLLLFNETDG